jgi:hypothetical protein
MDKSYVKGQLQELLATNKEIKGAVVATRDGLLLASQTSDMDSDRISAMISTALGLGRHLLSTASLGNLREINFVADEGQLSVFSVATNAVLAVISKPKSNFGMIQLQARRCAGAINSEGGY